VREFGPPAGGPNSLTLLVPWHEAGQWALGHLPSDRFAAKVTSCAPDAGSRVERMPPYLREWRALRERRPDWRECDVLLTWEMRAAFAARMLFRQAGRPKRWVALGPILKGPLRSPGGLALARRVLAGADRIACFTTAERDAYPRLLGLPPERFAFLPSTWPAAPVSREDGGYILALGQSGRDYPTLLEAVRGTDLLVVLVAATPAALGGHPVPPNVTVRFRTDPTETDRLVRGATLHAVPLRGGDWSAGQSVLLRAMACGKAVVVSDTAAVRDYVRPGETAVTMPPGDAGALRAALRHLWEDASARQRIGARAACAVREEFGHEAFAARLAALLGNLPPVPGGLPAPLPG